ncbi:MAG: DUF1178 domain-containing protein [Mesorhizobium amorphae]|nr:MAG: DUF1178 domain-containing protein [Mesorhizobium amorphae]
MIRFSLCCERGHGFEGWFRDNGDFDAQSARGLVECPVCGNAKVSKALMAPAVSTARKQEKMALARSAEQKRIMGELKALSEKMRENAEDVGDRFAAEARKIHFGEADARGIYGQATPEEAASLHEDGVEFLPLPTFPEDRN